MKNKWDIKVYFREYCLRKCCFRWGVWVLVLGFMMVTSGCNLLQLPVYLLFGQRTQKVKAQYTGLAHKKVALIVATGPGIDFAYPSARSNISLAVIAAIKTHIKGVEFVPYRKVEAFQDETLDWSALPMEQIARKFGVQRILYLDTYEFSMAETSSVYLLRGRVSAALRVYEADSANPDNPVYQTEIHVIYPEQGPLPMSDVGQIKVWRNSIGLFAKQLAEKFYDHKVEIKQ